MLLGLMNTSRISGQIDGRDPEWWKPHYPVYINENQVHSFYLDMWRGMETATYAALGNAVDEIVKKTGKPPNQIIITGHSMGGGIST